METNIVLVLLVGLPGSGKTTLCRTLKSYHEENQGCGMQIIIHLCYDDLIPLSVQREFVEQKRTRGQEGGDEWKKLGEEEGEEGNWKITGEQKDCRDWKSTDVYGDSDGSRNGRQAIGEDWKGARRKIHTQVDQFLQYINTGKVDLGVDSFFNIPLKALNNSAKYVILLDDNFYYRSMRYEFFQLARRHSAAFCQLYLECSTEEALRHNDMRVEKVPADVVMAMGERLQAPQSHLHPWEANTCVLKRGGVGQVSKACDVVFESFQHGLTPMEDRELEVAEARCRCSQSVVHQADLCMRAIVKHLVKEELQRAGERRSQASKVAGRINTARQTVLADLRGGALVPPHLADAITQDNRHEFEAFLEAEMRKKFQNDSLET